MAKKRSKKEAEPVVEATQPLPSKANNLKALTHKEDPTHGEQPGGDDKPPDDKPPEEGELPPIELYPTPVRVKDRSDRYTPFLVLRYAPGDIGGRPLSPGTVFWHSPDVWVRSSQGINQPVAGEPNNMFCRINNRGRMDAGWVRVRYWWANPSLAITEANAHLIGTADTYVPSGQSRVVQCPTPWVPVIENGGHECILAEAWCPDLDPLTAPLDPVSDRHVGQKNLHVIQVSSGATFRFTVDAMNIAPVTQRVMIHTRGMVAKEVQAALTAPDIGLSTRQVQAAPRPAPVRLDLAKTGMYPMAAQTTYARRLLALQTQATQARAQDCQPVGGVQLTETFEAGELRKVQITGQVPKGAKPGEAFGYEITQRLGNMVTGGYTLYVVVTQATQSDCPPQQSLNLIR